MEAIAYIGPREVARMEGAALSLRDKLLIRLLFRLGCRVTEAISIKVSDVDLRNFRVTILHLKTRQRFACPKCEARLGKKHSFCPGCGQKIDQALSRAMDERKQRVVPIDRETVLLIQRYVRENRLLPGSVLFPMKRQNAWEIITTASETAGLPRLVNPATGKFHKVSPHRLRDAFAVMAVQHGDSFDEVRMLQEQLGHANIGTTMKYRKLSGKELTEWYQGLWENPKK